MSEPMSSVEIEDVLSSIRRLVSEDLRPNSRKKVVAKAEEKLLLTPALRVVADEPAETVEFVPSALRSSEAHPSETRPLDNASRVLPLRSTLPRLHLGADPEIEEFVATLERAVEAQDVEWESEVGDPSPVSTTAPWTEEGWADAQVPEANFIDTDAEDAVAVTDTDDTWALEDLTDDTSAMVAAQPLPPMPEPDAAWADTAEAEAVAELDSAYDEPTEPAPPHHNPAFGSGHDNLYRDAPGEVLFDEAVLRDLVRDLIREELQGDLGERITRNVRKLVRAEIARALAVHDLE